MHIDLRRSTARLSCAVALVAVALASSSSCSADDGALLEAVGSRVVALPDLVRPGLAPADGAALVTETRATEARLAAYRAGEAGGVVEVDPVAFARDLTNLYNVNYGDLGAELPEQVTFLRSFGFGGDPFTPTLAVALVDSVDAYLRAAASRFDAARVRIRYVRIAVGTIGEDRRYGFNAYINLGHEVTDAYVPPGPIEGELPWSLAYDEDEEVDCVDNTGADDYIALQQNLALARQLNLDARASGTRAPGSRIVADFAGAALVTGYAQLGRRYVGPTGDADVLLQSTRFPRELGGEIGAAQPPRFRTDFPEAGQYLVHFDAEFDPGTGSGEVCMSESKVLQYVRDHTTLGEGVVEERWRAATGTTDASVRRLAANVTAAYGLSVERQRSHVAQFVYGVPFVTDAPPVARVP